MTIAILFVVFILVLIFVSYLIFDDQDAYSDREYKDVLQRTMGVVDETDFIYQSGKVNPARELYREMQDMRVQYVKLAERFKHHDKEKKTIETDWNDYLKYCDTWQFYFPKLHAAEIQQQYDLWFLLWDDINESKIKMTEITKRFDELDIS